MSVKKNKSNKLYRKDLLTLCVIVSIVTSFLSLYSLLVFVKEPDVKEVNFTSGDEEGTSYTH